MRYLITFACYGWHIHGDECGSVDRHHNLPGSRMLEGDSKRAANERGHMTHARYSLEARSREAVLRSIQETCANGGWSLLAAHVRTNHVHVIVEAECAPERVMNALKAYASRRLNESGLGTGDRKRWARHGSTRWLWKDEDVRAAMRYVADEQGEAMAVFVGMAP